MHVEDVACPAKMRIMYQVLGGRLPFGFTSELQVCLAKTDSRCDKELHFALEAAVIDRVTGSVLSTAYKCGGGRIREWVVISHPLTGQEQESEPLKVPVLINCICIMGWAEVSSQEGATDWRIFQMVMKEIEDLEMEHNAPGLCLQKMAFYMGAGGQISKPFDISRRHHATANASDLLLFEFNGYGKDAEDVDPDLVLPSLSETRLSKTQQLSEQTAASEGTRYGVDAFFAKRIDDHGIDVHAEGQLMMREIMNPVNAGSKWDCNVNPQPTLHDLRTMYCVV